MYIMNIEALLRERFIKLYREDVGKGPIQTNVGVTKNFIVVEFKGIFTKLEKNLLGSANGEEVVKNLRKKLKDKASHQHISEVENIFNCKVVDFISNLSVENDALIFLFIFEKNIEDLNPSF